MKLEIVFTAGAIKDTDVKGKVLVAFDVFRATSTIITVLEKKCAGVIPAVSVEEAYVKAREMSNCNKNILLAGELHGIKVPGMDFGNSPVEYLEADIANKILILSTSNGTHAIRNAQGASKIIIGALLNARAVAWKLIEEGRDVVFGCAGRLGEFSLEDFVAAGAVAHYIKEKVPGVESTDPVMAAEACFVSYQEDLTDFLRGGKHGRYLEKIGFEEDIYFCTRLNVSRSVPEFRDGKIKLF